MTDQEALYGAYLRGFADKECTPESVTHIAAYALGKRDASTTVVPPYKADASQASGPEVRTAGQVLDTVRRMVPASQSVPVDVDAMMAAGVALEREVGALRSQLMVATAELAARDKTITELRKAIAPLAGPACAPPAPCDEAVQ